MVSILSFILTLGVVVVLPIWLIDRAIRAGRRIEELSNRVHDLETSVGLLKKERISPLPTPAPAISHEASHREIPQTEPLIADPALSAPQVPWLNPAESAPLRSAYPPPKPPVFKGFEASTAPVLSDPVPLRRPAPAPPTIRPPAVNWEQFMGVKLFAWLGGLALFLGVAFFVKYSFDNNLVPPELRVAIGFTTGVGLLAGGVLMSRKDFGALSQTLCATGVVVLYAVTFACRSIYHFEFFGPVPTFLLMVLITTAAFLLAVRLNAIVVALLGMLGGFITPILLSIGVDNPLGLFGYIAILDVGLIVVALNRRWHFLTTLAAIGTALMQIGWAAKFFTSEKYFEGNKILIALSVLLGFNALYLAAAWQAKRRAQSNRWLSGSGLGLAAVALAFTAWFLSFTPLAERPWLLFGFVFLIDLAITALTLVDETVFFAQPLAGLAVFGLLALWTENSLSSELLNPALTFYFIFAAFHAAFPVFLQRRRAVTSTLWGIKVFPPLALLLVLIPIFKFTEISFLVWPFVLFVDLLAIGLAVVTLSIVPVLAAMILTLAALGALISQIPARLTGLPTSLLLLGAFAIFFVVASVWAVRRLKPGAPVPQINPNEDLVSPANLAALLPVFSAALPFLLLIMATLRLPLANPSPVFGLALLLTVLLLGLAKMFSFDWLPAVALASVAALEWAWHSHRFDPAEAALGLTWYLVFFSVFTLFPFVFMKQFKDKVVPWAVAALAGLPQFFLVHRLVESAYPNQWMGLLPAAFSIPPLISLAIVLKTITASTAPRMTQLAFFGGVALFFITLIFPIQFDRQWITLGWALEGAALLWLFHRVPHPGLRLTGVGLLIAAFARLALNPAVLGYHPRSATPIFNWYLYTYGTATLCLFAGWRLLAPPRNLVLKSNMPPILAGLGTVLSFLLLNIEIADFFSAPGSTLTFQFSGHFARDMTYSIAWALFALTLLVVGTVKKIPASRYAALGLLSVTLLKLFLHDLSQIGQLYKVGAFVGVAIIAMLASFAYQRFYAANDREKAANNETSL